jgi:hypothetical protein
MRAEEEESKDSTAKLPKEGAAALSALRNLWSQTGRERAFFGPGGGPEAPTGRDSMVDSLGGIGFGGLENFAEENEATTNTHQAAQNLSAAWKQTLQREGKMVHPGQSVSDLIGSTKEKGIARPPAGAEIESAGPPAKKKPWETEEDAPWDSGEG